jgi:hypothetical protein
MIGMRWANLAFAILATWSPLAHLLELPNKLELSGVLWLATQQQLYRGWGPFVGGPAEILALLTSLFLLARRWRDRAARSFTAIAAIAYAGMMAAFFLANDPVNKAVSHWRPETLPHDWQAYRLQWETGHAVAAVLSIIALGALIRAWFLENRA